MFNYAIFFIGTSKMASSTWQRGVASPSSHLDPNAYLPKPIRSLVNRVVESMRRDDWNEMRRIVKQRKSFMCAMMVYAVHQCSNSDKLKACERMLGLIDDHALRSIIVNGPYGRSGYSPLCRAAYFGSEQMLKFLISCGADSLYKNKHGEAIVDILEVGLKEALKASDWIQVQIVEKPSKKTGKLKYQLVFPNPNPKMVKRITVFSLKNVSFRKYDAPNVGYVESKRFGYNTDNTIFIRERFMVCKKYLEANVKWKLQQEAPPPQRIKRYLGKRRAALFIQTWWRQQRGSAPPKKKKPEKKKAAPPTIQPALRAAILACETLPFRDVQAFIDRVKGCAKERELFQRLHRSDQTIQEFVSMDLPVLKTLL
jgi:hypothetical protein